MNSIKITYHISNIKYHIYHREEGWRREGERAKEQNLLSQARRACTQTASAMQTARTILEAIQSNDESWGFARNEFALGRLRSCIDACEAAKSEFVGECCLHMDDLKSLKVRFASEPAWLNALSTVPASLVQHVKDLTEVCKTLKSNRADWAGKA